MAGVVGGSARILVDEIALERVVDEYGQLARRGRNRLGLPDSKGETPVESTEGGLGAGQAHGGYSKNGSGAARRGLCPGAKEPTARDFVVWRQGEPGSEMPVCSPARHVRPDLGDQAKRGVGPDAVQLAQVGVGQPMQHWSHFESRLVGATIAPRSARRERRRGRSHLFRKLGQAGFDLSVAGLDLALVCVEDLQVLFQGEQVLSAIMPSEGD